MEKNIRITTIALFVAMAVVLHWTESFIPRPAPFLKLGLANVMTLCTLYAFGGLWSIFVAVSRVFIASALSGSIFSPAFAFSLFGGLAAGLCMWAMPKSRFSPIGVSVGGAATHMAAQAYLATFIIPHTFLMGILPFFLLVSVLTGMVNGYLVKIIIETMEERRSALPPHEM
ncbi:MAG TPA: Gx transporter family protein [Deltaproteobacteria bacterium]|jgi:heptaprenyl diphosphate synthase|nr:Gx transporter family protein [Deltaproteobacteria bacterium]HQJ08696.1 Gx transporter family protein [Deltaproteobacteria bacterium]